MPTAKPFYGATFNFTITLASLASSVGLVAGRQSTAIDNNTQQGIDLHVMFNVMTGTSPTNGTFLQFWAFGSLDNSIFSGGAGGSDAAFTPVPAPGTSPAIVLLQSLTVTATSNQAYRAGPFSLAAAFQSFTTPRYVGVAVIHNTGAALNATGGNHTVVGMPVQAQSL